MDRESLCWLVGFLRAKTCFAGEKTAKGLLYKEIADELLMIVEKIEMAESSWNGKQADSSK